MFREAYLRDLSAQSCRALANIINCGQDPPFRRIIMSNPFLLASAGIFVATGRSSGNTTIAERICAAVAGKILEEGDKILDPASWRETVGMIPSQVAAGASERTVSGPGRDEPAQLAKYLCTRAPDPATLAELQTAIAGLVAKVPPLSALNCLTVSQSATGELRISLAIVGVDRKAAPPTATVELTQTIVNYGDATVASSIDEIFGSIDRLTNEPYYAYVDADESKGTHGTKRGTGSEHDDARAPSKTG